MDVIKAQLQVMSLPEQLFGGNSLQLIHAEHDLKLSFSAFPALAEWQQESLPPLQVSSAEQWSQSRELDIKTHQPLRFEYDWYGRLESPSHLYRLSWKYFPAQAGLLSLQELLPWLDANDIVSSPCPSCSPIHPAPLTYLFYAGHLLHHIEAP